MNLFSKYKWAIVAAAVVVAFLGYSYFFVGAPPQALSTSTAASSTAVADQDLIALLATLKTIKLDASLFSDPAYQSLQDFSQSLIPEPVGRTNPFAPLGNSAPPAPGTTGH